MLLSSTADCMYWTGRYFERAHALARVVRGYERMSLDLPENAQGLRPLLELVGRDNPNSDAEATLRSLVCDEENPSSVRGAVKCARENLRSARVVLPPAVWKAVNATYLRLDRVDASNPADLFSALDDLSAAASRVEGEAAASMTRDAAYSFLRIGSQVERMDMLVRSLAVLVPLVARGQDQPFDDVRWMGLLDCVGTLATFRRRHRSGALHGRAFAFLLTDETFPRSVSYLTRSVEHELERLPRPSASRAALLRLIPEAHALGSVSLPEFGGAATIFATVVERFDQTLRATYCSGEPAKFPLTTAIPTPSLATEQDPFEQLGREHGVVETVLRVLDDTVARASCGESVPREALLAIVEFFNDCGVCAHHEKEEAILMPALLAHGFDWFDESLARVRREHHQERYFLQALEHLARRSEQWSSEDQRQFVSVAGEFAQFLRAHMRHEQTQIFAPASERFSAEEKAALAEAFRRFDLANRSGVELARQRLATIELEVA